MILDADLTEGPPSAYARVLRVGVGSDGRRERPVALYFNPVRVAMEEHPVWGSETGPWRTETNVELRLPVWAHTAAAMMGRS